MARMKFTNLQNIFHSMSACTDCTHFADALSPIFTRHDTFIDEFENILYLVLIYSIKVGGKG